ncbi:MAG: aldo/keto reductase [Oscillospiraceae bacterium]
MKDAPKLFELGNGIKIPSVGLGTWRTPDGEAAVNAICAGVKCGYRHIDTAAAYANEKSVGEGIRVCGVPRSDLFITSKVWNTNRGYDKAMQGFDNTMSDLGLDYLDLYLIHWPASVKDYSDWKEINKSTWRAFETLYKDGRIKAIGLSNFFVSHLEALLDTAEIKPMVNQIEFHPGLMRPEVVAFCHKNDILVEAWSPLGSGRMLNNPELSSIAAKYGKSVAQLCIRWVLQNGILPLPKSTAHERIAQNIDVFDFEISGGDMAYINAMPYFGGSGQHPDEIKF